MYFPRGTIENPNSKIENYPPPLRYFNCRLAIFDCGLNKKSTVVGYFLLSLRGATRRGNPVKCLLRNVIPVLLGITLN